MKLCSQPKIGQRLGAGFAILLLLSMLITGISLWRLEMIAVTTEDMMLVALEKERLASDWYRNINASMQRVSAVAKSGDPELAAFFAPYAAEGSRQVNAIERKLARLPQDEQEHLLIRQIGMLRKQYLADRDAIAAAKRAGRRQLGERLFTQDFIPHAKAFTARTLALQAYQRARIDQTARSIDDLCRDSQRLMLLLGGLSLLFGVLCTWQITIGITVPPHPANCRICGLARSRCASQVSIASALIGLANK
jgi:methyl-accepting chemotaxis protein